MFIWLLTSRKKIGKVFYLIGAGVFTLTVISDILGLIWWEDVEVDSFNQYDKGVTIAHFVITMVAAVGLSLCCAFFPRCFQESKDQQQR